MNWSLIMQIWRPLLEIGILTLGYYYIFVLLRGTRGAAVVTGFLILLLTLTLVATVLELEVLSWLLRAFSAFLALAILVLFQPELRHLLAKVGHQPFLSNAQQQRENIEVVIQAAARMSEMRIGSLIALEQSLHLQETVESGIVVDCEATPEMLECIFFPNNAIHDGGVIIRGNRILCAACIFPLTQRQDLQKSMGTRHRAAIGMTEETDAVVVVISEETGSISCAHQGHLARGLTEEELRSFLTTVCVKRVRSKSFLEWLRAWRHEQLKKAEARTAPPSSQ